MGKINPIEKNIRGHIVKIVPDYTPKLKGKKLKTIFQICPVCKQSISTAKMSEHVRIELLDPKWKEQKAKALEKNKETNLTDNLTMFENLKQLSQARPDIFGGDEINLQIRIKEILSRDQEKQKIVWDGHTASIGSLTQKLSSTMEVKMVDYCKGLEEENNRIQEIGPRVIPESVLQAQNPRLYPQLCNNPSMGNQSSMTGYNWNE